MNKAIMTLILVNMSSVVMPVYAEIFIVNTQTLEPQTSSASQLPTSTPQFSLSTIDANTIRLLQQHQYTDKATAVNQRQQKLKVMTAQVASWMQHGASEQSLEKVRAALSQTGTEIQQSMAVLSGLDLPEFQQLYTLEEQNARIVQDLGKKLVRVRTVGAAAAVPEAVPQPAVPFRPVAPAQPASASAPK